ncbi:hypothetical protein ACHQM5_013541 [Ranunculus cassubicifolius]
MKHPIQTFSLSGRKTPLPTFLYALVTFIIFFIFLHSINLNCFLEQPLYIPPEIPISTQVPFAIGNIDRECDVFNGEWVLDKANRPLYKDFNATFMLEKLRGKRMMFVGDSLNRGQYTSLVCLLHRILPESAKSMQTFNSLTVFRAEEYNATIEFYWAPFLMESNSDNAIIHRIPDRIIRNNSINTHGRHWKGADIIVFNTYLWWMTGMNMKFIKGSFEEERKEIFEMETAEGYRVAMKSMVEWVQNNMDPQKNRVFFTSLSPLHEKSKDWGGEQNGNCYNQTMPIIDPTYREIGGFKGIMEVIKEEFDLSRVPITFLNITKLSEYRKDAHTAIYKKHWNPPTVEQLANPASYADCVHWCLPGLQDTWNELLYTKLFYK